MNQLTAPVDLSANNAVDPLLVLAENGKTFNWARRVLGADMGFAAAQLYAFCRHIDDIADGDAYSDGRGGKEMLLAIDAALAGTAPAPNHQTSAFLSFAAQANIPLEAARDLLAGLLADQEAVALESTDDLLVYGYQVAGTVGLMMACILRCREEAALPHAVCLGIAMQLTNIARDIAEDAEMGRRYVPGSWCARATASDIDASTRRDTSLRQEMQHAVAALLQLADSYYAYGYHGLAALPLRAHLSIAVAGYCYQAIGHKLRRNGFVYWQGRTVVGLGGKIIHSFKSLVSLRWRLQPLRPVPPEMLAPSLRSPHVRALRK